MNGPLARVLAGLAAFLLAATPGFADKAVSIGKVVFVDGEVTANGRLIDIGDLLTGPVTFKTGLDSSLEVVFGERNIFRLGSDTVAKVNFQELQKTVTLERGEFSAVLKHLAWLTGDPSFTLKTPTANAGVRGTSFHVITDGNRTYFCTCNGSVALADDAGANNVIVTAAHHQARVFTRGKDGKVTVTNAGLEGHSDSSMATLADRIGVKIDWTQPDLDH